MGNNFCVDFNDEDDNWGFNTGGEDGLVDFNDDREDELVVFNGAPFIDCFNKGFNDDDEDDDGERLGLLLLVVEVNVVNSASIELADEFEFEVVDSEFPFFSLNPVANDAQPFVFFVVVPLVNEEFELDTDGLLIVGLSDVVESDDYDKKERKKNKRKDFHGSVEKKLLLFWMKKVLK